MPTVCTMKTTSGCVTDTVTTFPMEASSVNNRGTIAIIKSIMPVIAPVAYLIATLKLFMAKTRITM
ncbi:hypothetical protein D3C73_1359480 [compost metagenome]